MFIESFFGSFDDTIGAIVIFLLLGVGLATVSLFLKEVVKEYLQKVRRKYKEKKTIEEYGEVSVIFTTLHDEKLRDGIESVGIFSSVQLAHVKAILMEGKPVINVELIEEDDHDKIMEARKVSDKFSEISDKLNEISSVVEGSVIGEELSDADKLAEFKKELDTSLNEMENNPDSSYLDKLTEE